MDSAAGAEASAGYKKGDWGELICDVDSHFMVFDCLIAPHFGDSEQGQVMSEAFVGYAFKLPAVESIGYWYVVYIPISFDFHLVIF